MADQENPVFQIQRVYLKDMSLEQPNSPAILLEQEQPSVDIQLGVEATPVAEGIFEVAVTATVQTKIKDKTVFRESLARVMRWDFDRVVMSHGRVLETDGKAKMSKAFDFLE